MTHSHIESGAGRNRERLRFALVLTSVYFVTEVVAGWLTGSLALLADAGHMLTDVAGLGLALFAIHMGDRPATPERTWKWLAVTLGQPEEAKAVVMAHEAC